jgi:adenine-specific DNA-methyltransferase
MAIGQTMGEIDGAQAAVATRSTHFGLPVPPASAEAALTYPGKAPTSDVLNPISSSFLTPVGHELAIADSTDGNALMWSDNFVALHKLIEDRRKARLIYLDPPYATGMDFQSRDLEHAYNDSLGDAQYVEFMRRRLILLREVLSDDGSIFVHIGHQMLCEVKLILDEVFGSKNFRNIITRRKCSSKNFTRNQFSNLNDYVLFYTKSSSYVWNQPQDKPDAEWIAREYPKVDSKGQYKLVPVHAPGVRKGETGTPWRGMNPPPGKHWQYAPAKLDELDANGEIHWSKTGNPRRKVYLPADKGIALTDYWDKYRDAHHQSILITGYPTEKNFEMMKMLVSATSNPGDLVLDPFCGSGSTLHAAEELGRQWVGIDQSLLAIETSIHRLQNGRAPMGDFVKRSEEPDLFTEDCDGGRPHEAVCASFRLLIDSELLPTHRADVLDLARMMTKR